ncbi:MAG: PAS domain-containing protein [Elusimicrobiales bacterium]
MVSDTDNDTLLFADESCAVIFAPPSMRSLTGKSASSYAGTDLRDHCHPRDIRLLEKSLSALIARPGKPASVILRLACAGGGWLRCKMRGFNFLGDNPAGCLVFRLQPAGISCALNCRNVSEPLMSEAVIVDGSGKILYMNEAAAAPMGGRPENFAGKTLREVYPAEYAADYTARAAQVLSSGKSMVCAPVVPVGSCRLRFMLDFQPVREDSGAVKSVLIMNTDITGIEISGEDILKPDVFFPRVITNRPGMFKTRSGRLVEVNHALVNLLGYDSARELAAAAPRFPASITARRHLPPRGRAESFMRTEIISKAGEHIPVLLRIIPASAPGDAEGIIEDLRGHSLIWRKP